ncbi:MAG: class I SAM-dependent methyltransferase [Verrucomicrobiota bacterium]|jgi:SAM-dependent methyltransferase
MSGTEGWRHYPLEAEAFWVREAETAMAAIGEEALERTMLGVAELSDLFTTERPEKRFPDYFADPKLLAAYGVFFLPQSFIRTSLALDQACRLRQWRPASSTPSILDLGSGPGSCGVAAAYRLKSLGFSALGLTGVDKSPSALVAMEAFAHEVLGDGVGVRSRVGDIARPETWPEGQYDLIVAGFVLNEMPLLDQDGLLKWVELVRRRLCPGGMLLILEPALKITAEKLQRLSDVCAGTGLIKRIAPDLDQLPDPQLSSGEHWSHEARPWQAPASTEFVNRRLHRDLREVRFSFAAFSDAALPALPTGLSRLVSDVQIIKGLLRFITIRTGCLEAVEIPTRGLSKHEVKKLAASFGRGDVIRHEHPPSPRLRLIDYRDFKVFWTADKGLPESNLNETAI